MNPTVVLALQSLLVTLQTVNAGIAALTHNTAIALVVGALVGGFQFFVQHIGNKMSPESPRLTTAEIEAALKRIEPQ